MTMQSEAALDIRVEDVMQGAEFARALTDPSVRDAALTLLSHQIQELRRTADGLLVSESMEQDMQAFAFLLRKWTEKNA